MHVRACQTTTGTCMLRRYAVAWDVATVLLAFEWYFDANSEYLALPTAWLASKWTFEAAGYAWLAFSASSYCKFGKVVVSVLQGHRSRIESHHDRMTHIHELILLQSIVKLPNDFERSETKSRQVPVAPPRSVMQAYDSWLLGLKHT
eukprot:scaffold926_cov163-Amphora_coffeaeformis.AAC.7